MGSWWAAVYGVTQSQTQLKWLSSSMPDFEGFPGGTVVKNPPANAGDTRDVGLISGSVMKWQPTPIFFTRKFHRQRNLGDCSPQSRRVRHDWEHMHACLILEPISLVTIHVSLFISITILIHFSLSYKWFICNDSVLNESYLLNYRLSVDICYSFDCLISEYCLKNPLHFETEPSSHNKSQNNAQNSLSELPLQLEGRCKTTTLPVI